MTIQRIAAVCLREGAMRWGIALLGVLFFLTASLPCQAERLAPRELITIIQGQESILPITTDVDRILLGTSGIVSVLMPDRQKLTIRGLSPGFTTLTVRSKTGMAEEYAVRVKSASSPVLDQIAAEIRNYLKDIPSVTVDVREDKILLAGSVDPSLYTYYQKIVTTYGDIVEDLAQPSTPAPAPLAPSDPTLRSSSGGEALPSIPTESVRIDCQVVEVSRDSTNQLGIEWFPGGQPWSVQANGNLTGATQFIGVPGAASSGGTQNGPAPSLGATSSGTSGTSTGASGSSGSAGGAGNPAPSVSQLNLGGAASIQNLNFNLIALAQRGKARFLATPKLTVESGKKASFLVGGEVPIVSTTGLTSTVNYKKFGTQLEIAPEIRSASTIFINVTATVSDLDFGRAVQGNPTISSREATTNVTIKDNVTFAIAGLMSRNVGKNISKVPILGDIPLIGYLFKSESEKITDVETIVLITPQIIQSNPDNGKARNEIPLSPEIQKAKTDLTPVPPKTEASSTPMARPS